MDKLKEYESGVVTVFLALAFTCITALLLTLVESARTAGLRYYQEAAANAAIDSVFSEYSNELWDDYRLILLYSDDDEKLISHYTEFMKPYLKARNWMVMNDAQAEIVKCDRITSAGGRWLEQEILDYMHYGVIEGLFSMDESPEDIKNKIREAETVRSIADSYAEQSGKAVELEKCVEQINASAKSLKQYYSSAQDAIGRESNASFQYSAQRLKREINHFSTLVRNYQNYEEKLRNNLNDIANKEVEVPGGLSGDSQSFINELSESSGEYLELNSERMKQIEEVANCSDRNQAIIDQTIDSAMDIYADNPDEPPVLDEKGDILIPGVSHAADRSRAWRELSVLLSDITIDVQEIEPEIQNKEAEKEFENARASLDKNLLELFIPEGMTVSGAVMNRYDIPSVYQADLNRDCNERSPYETMLIGRYAGRFFNSFTSYLPKDYADELSELSDVSDRIEDAGGTADESSDDTEHAVKYEMEYIASGGKTDKECLTQTTGEIFLMREGMNYLYILNNSEMRGYADALAASIVGASGIPFLKALVSCLIMGVWAGGESIIDCRKLFHGHKIPLIKGEDDWELDESSILSLGKNIRVDLYNGEKETGSDYSDYLEFLIDLLESFDRNYRMMDVIQNNMNNKQPDFKMRNCIYGIKIKTTCTVSHLFAPLGDAQIVCDAVKAY